MSWHLVTVVFVTSLTHVPPWRHMKLVHVRLVMVNTVQLDLTSGKEKAMKQKASSALLCEVNCARPITEKSF